LIPFKNAFLFFLKEMCNDLMLICMIFVPIVSGIAFKFIVPLLSQKIGIDAVVSQYYILLDLSLGILTSIIFAFIGVMVILDEFDSGISKYLCITSLKKSGYLFSRIGVLPIISILYNLLLLLFLKLSRLSILQITSISVICGLTAIMLSLFVVSISSNKVEGMAATKLSGLVFVGVLVPFFITGKLQYVVGWMPTFYLAKYLLTGNFLNAVLSIIVEFIWIICLLRKFKRKLY